MYKLPMSEHELPKKRQFVIIEEYVRKQKIPPDELSVNKHSEITGYPYRHCIAPSLP
jgi:hypothetical protein